MEQKGIDGMKRGVIIILIALLLGAVANIAVAWACALWSRSDAESTHDWGSEEDAPAVVADLVPSDWHMRMPGRVGWIEQQLETKATFGLRVTAFGTIEHLPGGDPTTTPSRELCLFRSGFPLMTLRCVGYANWIPEDLVTPMPRVDWEGGVAAPTLANPLSLQMEVWHPLCGEPLPLTPEWLGFTINTAIYAVVLLPLGSGSYLLRRLVRYERGRCPKCDYDLRREFAAGCSECGWKRAEATD